MIVDPSRVKFVNGKFILATNDKSNPIQLVRQKNEHILGDMKLFSQSVNAILFKTPVISNIFSNDSTVVTPSDRVWQRSISVKSQNFKFPYFDSDAYGSVFFRGASGEFIVKFDNLILCPLESVDEICNEVF